MTRYVVLGAGRVGGLIARDLAWAPDSEVVVADRDPAALETARRAGARVAQVDLSSQGAVHGVIADADVVVGAVPGFIGDRVLAWIIAAGKPAVDIAFAPEDPLRHDAAARAAGVPVVVDCGVAPGLSNLLVGRGLAELERAESVVILVGGLPVRRTWPYEYLSVFSPTDVVEEYTRPSRIRVHGVEVVRPALSEVEPVEFPGIGTLEAFNTDGLRTLLRTVDVPNLVEKTLRFPGHADRMRMLRATGFFDTDLIDLDGVSVIPRRMTEALMFRAWEPRSDDDEFTVLQVRVVGFQGDVRRSITWDLLDRTDARTRETSMARTTGYPCAIAARLLAEGVWDRPGVHPPEILGRDAAITGRILAGLAERGVDVRRTDREVN